MIVKGHLHDEIDYISRLQRITNYVFKHPSIVDSKRMMGVYGRLYNGRSKIGMIDADLYSRIKLIVGKGEYGKCMMAIELLFNNIVIECDKETVQYDYLKAKQTCQSYFGVLKPVFEIKLNMDESLQ